MLQQSTKVKLNFYSKYNRVKQKQDISSLYALIDNTEDYIAYLQNLTLTLKLSKDDSNIHQGSPIRMFTQKLNYSKQFDSKVVGNNVLEQDINCKYEQMEQKLSKLDQLEKKFHQQLETTQKQYLRKKQQKELQKRQKIKNKNQQINVVEPKSEPSINNSTSQHQYSKHYHEANISHQTDRQQQPAIDDDDYYYRQVPQIKNIEKSRQQEQDMRKKIKEIMEAQRSKEKYVQSVEQDIDGRASSVVIDRLNINIDNKENQIKNWEIERDNQNIQPNKNYYQIELSHSQSENILPQFRQMQNQTNHLYQVQENIDYQTQQIALDSSHKPEEIIITQEEIHSQKQHSIQESNNQQIHSDNQQEQLKKITEDHSESKDQIQDRVKDIDCPDFNVFDHEEIDQNPSNLYYSQANRRTSLHQQKEVQSIAQSLDFHPLQATSPIHNINAHQDNFNESHKYLKEDKRDTHNDKKVSFKKLMASNRASLVPRLAISTILNEHINEALGDHKHIQHLPSPVANQNTVPIQIPTIKASAGLNQSMISSQSPIKSTKVNFKKILQMSRHNKSVSRDSKGNTSRIDTFKQDKNKKLLIGFFDQN